MSVYYHVSADLSHSGHFEPRIPQFRHQDAENALIARVCVAPAIEDCLTAIPGGGSELESLCMETRYYFLVFKIDAEKLGISASNIVTSDELFEKDLVRDAEMTNEHWITVPFTVPEEDRFIIRITNWDEEACDVIPFSIYKIADENYEGDYCEAYENTYDEPVPCSVMIKNLKYVGENVKKKDKIPLFFEDDCEKKLLMDYVKEKLPAYEVLETTNEVHIAVTEDISLKELFLHHYDLARRLL